MLKQLKPEQGSWPFLITAGVLFVVANAFLIREGYWLGWGLPFVLIIVLLLVFSFDKLLWITVLFTPLSVRYENVFAGVGMDVPSDIFITLLSVSVIFKFLFDERFDKRILKHPLSIAIMLNLVWLLFTSITSSMPLVSLKFLVSRSWYVLLFYFVLSQTFSDTKNIKKYLWLYMIPLIFVVFYTLMNHNEYNFDQRASYGMSQPFFVNHGIYAAALAMFLPFLWLGLFGSNKMGYSLPAKICMFLLLCLFLVGMVFSYTRAAWISLAAAIAIGALLYLRFSVSTYVLGIFVAGLVLFSMKDRISLTLQRNQQVSADNFDDHVKSIYNIKNDDSNLERINRWKCAFRMTEDRPVLGFGPGTYVFQYAPYQRAKEITKISTNVGSLGNCHSEFLQPLAETGIPGFLTWLILIATGIFTGIKLYWGKHSPEVKALALSATLGLITYFVHGLLNNYSDLDKAAVLIWGFFAIIVSLDVYHTKQIKT